MTSPAKDNQQLSNEGKSDKYFHIMLNIADDDLDVYEYRLLGHYIRVCGVHGDGECWESTRTTAKKCKMSVGKVSSTRQSLREKGYISLIASENHDKGDTLMIKVIDRWADNINRYSQDKRSPHEHKRSPHEHKRSPHEHKRSPHETKKNYISKINDELPPISPAQSENVEKQGTGVSTDLKAMKQAARQLKAYGDVGDRVAKTLLNLHEDDDKNVGNAPFKPDDIPKFVAWWTAKYPDLTIPRNSQSCVKWFNIWRDELETVAKPIVREIITLEQPPDNSEFMRQMMALPKVAGNHHG